MSYASNAVARRAASVFLHWEWHTCDTPCLWATPCFYQLPLCSSTLFPNEKTVEWFPPMTSQVSLKWFSLCNKLEHSHIFRVILLNIFPGRSILSLSFLDIKRPFKCNEYQWISNSVYPANAETSKSYTYIHLYIHKRVIKI